jgi:hypothetical protein
VLYQELQLSNPLPGAVHLKVYECWAYSLIHKILCTRKLAPRAHIGYLVRYDSTNIFCIWILSKKKVIRTRDVIFDENLFYDLNKPDLAQLLQEEVEQIVEVVNILSLILLKASQLQESLDLDTDLKSENKASPSLTDTSARRKEADITDSHTQILPTPENTPGPQDLNTQLEHTIEPHLDESLIATTTTTREIISDFSEVNIIERSHQQKLSDCQTAYFTELEQLQKLPVYLSTFSSDLLYSCNQ